LQNAFELERRGQLYTTSDEIENRLNRNIDSKNLGVLLEDIETLAEST